MLGKDRGDAAKFGHGLLQGRFHLDDLGFQGSVICLKKIVALLDVIEEAVEMGSTFRRHFVGKVGSPSRCGRLRYIGGGGGGSDAGI